MASQARYLLGSYRIATAPEPNSRRLTSFKSTSFDSPANSVGPWPAILGCTTKAVEMRLYRARQQLRARLGDLLEAN